MVARVRNEEPNCWFCGLPIDLALDAQTHPLGSTVDETIPRSRAADPGRAALTRSNLHHMHRRCNSEKGDRLVIEEKRSREW